MSRGRGAQRPMTPILVVARLVAEMDARVAEEEEAQGNPPQ